jgi:hypothetical protein
LELEEEDLEEEADLLCLRVTVLVSVSSNSSP